MYLLKKGGVELIGDPSVIVQEYYQDSKGESYKSSESDSDIYFREVYTCEKNGNPLSNFAHTQDINLRLTIGVNKYAEYQNIGICLLRQDKKRVFTVNKQLKEFYENGMAEIIVDFVIKKVSYSTNGLFFFGGVECKSREYYI